MKTHQLLFTTIGLLAAGMALSAAPTPPIGSGEVAFFEPEKFTDIRSSANSDGDRNGYLDQFRDYVASQAALYVPAGQKLAVTFLDIDLAGDFPPGRSARMDDVRIVKEIYPPRLVLSFRLTGAEGNVLKQGKRELTDHAFLLTSAFLDRSDSLRYEKALLNGWFRDEFPRERKG